MVAARTAVPPRVVRIYYFRFHRTHNLATTCGGRNDTRDSNGSHNQPLLSPCGVRNRCHQSFDSCIHCACVSIVCDSIGIDVLCACCCCCCIITIIICVRGNELKAATDFWASTWSGCCRSAMTRCGKSVALIWFRTRIDWVSRVDDVCVGGHHHPILKGGVTKICVCCAYMQPSYPPATPVNWDCEYVSGTRFLGAIFGVLRVLHRHQRGMDGFWFC